MPSLIAAMGASWALRPQLEAQWRALFPRVDSLSAVLIASILVISLAEGWMPLRREWGYRFRDNLEVGLGRLMRDLFFLFVVAQVSAVAVGATSARLSGLLEGVGLGFSGPRGWWPAWAPAWARLTLAFFLVELGSYWYHRAEHRFRVLWQFHATHHVVTELTCLKALRTHPVDNVLAASCRALPLLLLGATPEEATAAYTFGSMLGLLSHANLDVAEGPLGLLVNFPRFHTVHHSADLREANANFGCHTVLWDRVFGTFRGPAREGLVVGVPPVGPRSLWQELVWPFYRWVS